MSFRLPFKPIFSLDYDQELVSTVTAQVKKYSSSLSEQLTHQPDLIPSDLQKSFDLLQSKDFSVNDIILISLSLYFAERSFVKATEQCIQELLSEDLSNEKVNTLFSVAELWSHDLTPLFSVYNVLKGQQEQKIIQLTDVQFTWIDSFIPSTKKHEYNLFGDKFHQQSVIINEESLLAALDLPPKKKVLLPDQTKDVADLETNIIESVNNNKLTILQADFSSFEIRQFIYNVALKFLQNKKQILYQEIDFFKIQFAELFQMLNMVYIASLDHKSFADQYELLNSLRNTPSIIVLTGKSWDKFESMSLFTKEIAVYSYPKKDLSNKEAKEYIAKFTKNYIDTSTLQLQDLERNDLVETIIAKSAGSLSYIESLVQYLESLPNPTFTNDFLNNLPADEIELESLLFKTNFMDDEAGTNFLSVLVGLAKVQTIYSLTNFTQNQLTGFKDKILAASSSTDTIDAKLFTFFTKKGKYYSFTSTKVVYSLLDPSKYFDDERTDNFKVKKLLLQIQDFFTNLPVLVYDSLFKSVLLENLQKNDSASMDNLLSLVAIDPEFYTSLQEIGFQKVALLSSLHNSKNTESDLLKKPYNESVAYMLYRLEYYFDAYIVKGQYNTSQAIVDYLEATYDLLGPEYKTRFHFQKARQLIAKGELQQAQQELAEATVLSKRDKSFWAIGIILRLQAETYFINKQPLFGNYCFDQILQMYSRILPHKMRFKGYSLLKLSDRLNETGLFAYALQSVEEAIHIFSDNDLSLEEITAQQKAADILYKLGQTDISVKAVTKAMELAGNEDKTFIEKLESLRNAFKDPELYHPFFSFKNWTKINYMTVDSLVLQVDKYRKIFTENLDKEISEDYLQQLLYYMRLLFKVGNIRELRLALDYLERHIPTKSPNKGLLYLELSLIHNYLANIEVANYYSDLAKSSLFSLPIEYDISLRYQVSYIGFQLYNGRFELSELLIQDQFLRKKRKFEAELYLYYAYLEAHKNQPNDFDRYYDQGNALKREHSEESFTKQEVKLYGAGLLRDQYSKLFPIVNIPKKDLELLEEINWLFYHASVDVQLGSYTAAIEKLAKVESLARQVTNDDWKTDITINYLKKFGQVYYNDKSSAENNKKCIMYWQKALKTIAALTNEEPLLYLFERLDMLYLIGKSAYQFKLLKIEEANKYLISGKNLIRKHKVHNSLQLEFQFDTALGMNYFEAQDYTQAIKYYNRALGKHDNKLYAELRIILLNLSLAYKETHQLEELQTLETTYADYIKIFNLDKEIATKE